ncbi:DNA polymerase III, subunit gamma and tau [Leptospira noguchii str. 1993005606]|uniref:DNA polymerase III subunit gamma/tau n=1 Tax=Leptospira noguchii TaxID=28182 RepID=UPI000353EE7D|nr:DNA polymerase III subunit gamma/tau [Leptospira noguchii]EPE85578.1 DNA polymerase III, subunit gamma and tau [Leptospira noguchii str. 1993005606]
MARTHEVLSRKYRPQKFQDVIHQDLAIGALQNALKSGKIGHAYIFFGPRGVGKTTIARILAKRLNCQNPINNEPCNECNSCNEITRGISSDVLEIDAASNRGIENIRELRDNVKFAPMGGKYKVYIIDEVHMLTDQSFNALLKTLEEPPSHIVFVLATTEFHKIPETILSRCQDFIFKKVPLSVLQDYSEKLCKIENVQYDQEGLFWVAKKGDGSVRDMLSFMEQAIVFTDSKLLGAAIRKMIGYHGIEFLTSFIKSLVDPDNHSKSLEIIESLYQEGQDIYKFLWDSIEFTHTLNLIRDSLADPESVNFPKEDLVKMKLDFENVDSSKLNFLSGKLFEIYERIKTIRLRNSFEIKVFTEIQIKKLVEELTYPSLAGLIDKINHLILMVQGSKNILPDTSKKKDKPSSEVILESQFESNQQDSNLENTKPIEPSSRKFDTSTEIKKKFLGTEVDPNQIPKLDS